MIKIISIFILSFLFYSCENIFTIFREEDLLKRPPSKRCSDCHKEIYNQWKKSRHSKSWISSGYKKATQNYSKTKCFSCHIPYEIKVGEKPEVREKHREEGVNCVACHFKEETMSMHGPYDVFSPPHPSTEDKNYMNSKICSGCHEKTYRQWELSKDNRQCQDCHMPGKKGSLIQKFPFEYLHLPKTVHSHIFLAGKASAEDIKINIFKIDKGIKISIENTGIPHNLPTADNGKPKVYLTVVFLKDKKEVYRDGEMFFPKFSLVYKEKYENIYISPNKFDSVKIILERKLSWQKKKEKILELTKKF